MRDTDDMTPDASPGDTSKKSGVRRVNNLPLYITGGLMMAFLLIMVLVAVDRSEKQNRPAGPIEDKAGNTAMYANELAGNRKSGFVPAVQAATLNVPESTPPATGAPSLVHPESLEAQPTLPGGATQQHDQRGNDERERIQMAKRHQLEEAIHAKTSVQFSPPRSAASAGMASAGTPTTNEEALARLATVRQQIEAQIHDNPTAAYQARLQQLRIAEAGTSGAPVPRTLLAQNAGTGGAKDYSQFDSSGQEDRWKLGTRPEPPRSPYELRAGYVVPALLISGINSDLPGQIVAQVSQDVFDTATGKWKLIPQGSRLVGRYASDVAYGQSRVLIAWQRIVFPDGKAMDIGAMPGADSAGYAGFNDQVNNHYFRLFSSALLMSGVTAGIALSQPETLSTTTRQSASGAMSEALGQQLGQVTAQLITRNMNIAPTLEIRPGYRFNVIVIKDMTFSKPYQPFDY